MNDRDGQPLEAVPWSPRRWALTIGILFAGQILLLMYFGERAQPAPPSRSFPTRVILVPRSEMDGRLSRNAAINDPTLFALAHPQGFSGEAWLSYPPLGYELAPWTEPPRWLELSETRWIAPLARYLPTNPPPSLAAIQSRPRLSDWPVYAPPPSLLTASTLRIAGDLTPTGPLPALPSWPAAEILGDSVVRLLVLPDGTVFSAVLLQESGSQKADQRALELARQLEFSPVAADASNPADPGARSVDAWFRWHTVPEPQRPEPQAPQPAEP